MSDISSARKFSSNLIRLIKLSFNPEDVEKLDGVTLDLNFNNRGYCHYIFNSKRIGGKGETWKKSIGRWEKGKVRYRDTTPKKLETEMKYIQFGLSTYLKKTVEINHNIDELKVNKKA